MVMALRTMADKVNTDTGGVDKGSSFIAPKVHVNPNGWGPTPDYVPAHFADVPYAPFGKSDRIGRSADFVAPNYARNYRGKRDDSQVCVYVCVMEVASPRLGGGG